MAQLPTCPQCESIYTYVDNLLYICPECAYEWNQEGIDVPSEDEDVVKDAYGTILNDGDSVTIIKDLKVKGANTTVKVGTKVKSIRIVDGAAGHNIDCKIDGIGAMQLKSEFVKKA